MPEEIELDEEQEAALERAWEKIDKEGLNPIVSETSETDTKTMSAYAEGSGGALVPPPKQMLGRIKPSPFRRK